MDAVVANRGDEPAHEVFLGIVVAGPPAGERSDEYWTVLEMHPSGPIATVAAGESIEFSAKVRLDLNAAVKIGVSGQTATGPLLPEARRVRVIEPTGSLVQTGIVFGVFLVVLGGGATAARWAFRTVPAAPALAPHRWVLGAGFGLLLLGPGTLWFRVQWLDWRSAYGGVLLFGLGWLLIGAGLRPRRRAGRGAVFAVAVYGLVGLAWVVVLNVGIAVRSADTFLQPATLAGVLLWPFEIAQVLGVLNY